MAFKMEYGAKDYDLLSYLLFNNQLSFDEVIDWSYRQFKTTGVDPLVEKITLATDSRQIFIQ